MATVRQISKSIVRVFPNAGYDVSLMVGKTEVEAYISATDGSETVIMKMQPPEPGKSITLVRGIGNDVVDVVYG